MQNQHLSLTFIPKVAVNAKQSSERGRERIDFVCTNNRPSRPQLLTPGAKFDKSQFDSNKGELI
jgi:hypothetical protein